MNKYVLSVVIPCKDDAEIINCIKSIGRKDVEISIVFNGATSEFIQWVKDTSKKMGIGSQLTVHILEKPNLAKALEFGTIEAKAENVLYMDSDCVFKEGAVSAFIDSAKKMDMAKNVLKGTVIFEEGSTWIESVIAASREHHTAEVLTAYKPPLLISKKILQSIGGYAFNHKLIWREDADLDNRIRVAGIAIQAVPKGTIYHHSISLKTDLRSTFRYGIGLAIANVMNITLTEVPRSVKSTLKSKGFAPAAYMVFRNRVYDVGYLYARTKILFGKYVR